MLILCRDQFWYCQSRELVSKGTSGRWRADIVGCTVWLQLWLQSVKLSGWEGMFDTISFVGLLQHPCLDVLPYS